ncbi:MULTISPECIES: selenide, water dikinase SelD [unclassified Luteimonas]|uniref:selenide, water dikinase SelD n=1 Tax=unclassified Luteimonas TaxID=2629088 RepID=UPI0018F0862E|nr:MULTISPECIES: selenide, water dikinase SelD [unclassified Luteimonas]MBJ6979370.1 selenide, water dikinase SelD [Luteimonas sp. MC1895]MBJ6984415.1 selenide, water dikinase SelD [Luteimonas sp. MC1750]QQO04967.1 selenide, water dikinase SelD [Luteimonas sp. MC1750]
MSADTPAPAGATKAPRLTSLSHGGGCGCKIAPGVLADLLKRSAPARAWPQLMVGNDTADDAAVYRLNDQQALIATTDFFMPIVDDPYDFGRIAATNALSDVYAMGGTPVMALALVGMPVNVLPHAVIAGILRGGEDACAAAGIPVAGGHSIDSVEPIYGLAAMGLAHPDRIRRNVDARPGDLLVLGKPLGVGIQSAALKRGRLDAAGYRAMIDATTRLNTPGIALAALDGVHAMTDVTGFGLLGHALELARGAGLTLRLRYDDLPWLPGVQALAADGVVTGASARNWAACGEHVQLGADLDTVARDLLTDPQTSGGLLVSCAPQALGEVLDIFHREGFAGASVIGETRAGPVRVEVG